MTRGPKPTPQEAQRDGQSAISRENPSTELNQEGSAGADASIGRPLSEIELTDEEVSLLCDIERHGSAKPHQLLLAKSLIERGFVFSSDDMLLPLKLTRCAMECLTERGVGLNES
jgi:hypothetical protein